LQCFDTQKYFNNFFQQADFAIPSLESMGFNEVEKSFPS
jgi:hypothetical protein